MCLETESERALSINKEILLSHADLTHAPQLKEGYDVNYLNGLLNSCL